MSNALTVVPSDINLPREAAERQIPPATWATLKGALYPGKSDNMVLLAFDYCRARGLDPVKKPVHIVKTWDADQGAFVETIWEGINSHRVTAARTGLYAGQDEPEFGPDVTRAVGSSQMTFPAWCKVTVYRLIGGQRCAFVGLVRWMETYSQKKGGDPTAMWRKRPYSQLAKCAEAEALRKAFPEELGGRPTAEEMDGQGFENAHDVTPPRAASRLDAIEDAIPGVIGPTPSPAPAVDPATDDGHSKGDGPSAPESTGSGGGAPSAWDRHTAAGDYQVGNPFTRETRRFAAVEQWCAAICALAHERTDAERARLWRTNAKMADFIVDKFGDGTEAQMVSAAHTFVTAPDPIMGSAG